MTDKNEVKLNTIKSILSAVEELASDVAWGSIQQQGDIIDDCQLLAVMNGISQFEHAVNGLEVSDLRESDFEAPNKDRLFHAKEKAEDLLHLIDDLINLEGE